MGTETLLDSVYTSSSGRNPVKLNNPLMGTETFTSFTMVVSPLHGVKLNNPLMGTETHFLSTEKNTHKHAQVKLNNPLMGTETIVRSYQTSHCNMCRC